MLQITGGVIGYIAFGLMWIASAIAGVLIALITYFIGVILQLSDNVVNTFAVQSGYTITLAVANLGFVLAIIVIAIATILRRETYGIKKTLWKLVVAAILVNFSLVIGGAIINFANVFTNAFLSELPSFQGSTGPLSFANSLAGAFSPQRAFINTLLASSTAAQAASGGSSWWSVIGNALAGGAGPVGSIFSSVISSGQPGTDLAGILTPLIEVTMAAGFLIVILITLAVFLFQLLIRYVFLALLLILMPFAWLMWLFPKTSHLWTRWWSQFIRWTFFAPIVVFFLWLAIATAQNMNNNSGGDLSFLSGAQYKAQGGAILSGFSTQLGSFVGTFAVTLLQGVVVIGLAIGGMIAANKFSIMGSSAAMAGMKYVSNAAQGYVGRRSKQALTAPLRSEGVRNLSSRMQQQSDRRMLRLTGLDYLKRKTGQVLETGAVLGGEKAVQAAKKQYEGLTPDQRINRIDSAEGPYGRIELLREIAEDKSLGRLSSAQLEKYLGKDQKDVFKKYGQEKLYMELRQKSGLAFKDLEEEISGMRTKGDDPKKIAQKELERDGLLASYIEDNADAATDAFANPDALKIKRDEASKKFGRIPVALDPEWLKTMQDTIARGITKGLSPHNVSSLMTSLSKKNSLDGLRSAVENIRATNQSGFAEMQENLRKNNSVLNWNDKNLGRGTLDINLREVYGIGGEPPKGEPLKKSGGEPRRVVLTDDRGNIINPQS